PDHMDTARAGGTGQYMDTASAGGTGQYMDTARAEGGQHLGVFQNLSEKADDDEVQ
uniref:Uncharacterized protein n=1 Tax=Otolemur garnettii TaxID=30611 RepID=H0XX43_OTOGA